MPLEPILETRDALDSIGRWSDADLTADLTHQGQLVEQVVPDLVGLSLWMLSDGLTFTLAATKEHLALLDAVQYVVDGPCVEAARKRAPVSIATAREELLDEKRWAVFARASAARGVLSTLSLPIQVDGRVVGGVNLYAAGSDAFDGKEQRVSDVFGA